MAVVMIAFVSMIVVMRVIMVMIVDIVFRVVVIVVMVMIVVVRVVMVVVMVMDMRMVMTVVMGTAGIIRFHIFRQEPRPQPRNQQPRDETQPRDNIIRDEIVLCEEHDDTKSNDAEGMRESNNQSEKDRIYDSPFRADEIRRHHCLPVSRGQSVESA